MDYFFKCSKCGNSKDFSKLSDDSDNGIGCLIFLLGGFILYLLHNSSMQNRIQCGNCGLIFQQPRPVSTSITRLSKWIIAVMLLCPFIGLWLTLFPELVSSIPEHWMITTATGWVETYPKIIVLTMLPMMLIIVLMLIIVSIASTRKANEILNAYYKTKVPYKQYTRVDPLSDPQSIDYETSSIVPPNEDSDTHPPPY